MKRFTGLVAAVPTPMRRDGAINLDRVPAVVDHLVRTGIKAIFVCGSTGESSSLTMDERRETALAYVRASAGRLPVIIHVGHNCLRDAASLAAHAADIGAQAIAATPPSYFKPADAAGIVACCVEIARGARTCLSTTTTFRFSRGSK